jgi:hypothetical protein
MRQSRSADPWSSFLDPQDGSHHENYSTMGTGGGRAGAPPEEARQPLSEPARQVLALIQAEAGEIPVRQLGDRLGLGLLEVAEAVRVLRSRQLVEVVDSGQDESVRAHRSGG